MPRSRLSSTPISVYRKQQREELKERIARRGRVYGLLPGEALALAEKQLHRCAICKRRRPLVIDHDHKTSKVRGLLCNNCNIALGLFEDKKSSLANAIKYLGHRPPRKMSKREIRRTFRGGEVIEALGSICTY